LLIRGNAFLILDLRLHVFNRVRRFHIKSDGLASQRFHEDLHATTKAQHQVEGRLLLDIVVRKGAAIFQLLASENQALLIRGNAFLILDLRLHVFNRVRRFHIKSDGLASQRFHEDLHATTQAQHQVQSGLLLDVVVRKGAAIFELLASENQALLIRGNSFLVLDLGLHRLNRVR